ncbi:MULTISPECIES: DUF421 domain-containing protein [unclassified Bacillus (in: firmicutes)]|uniref:DUF421 domain-containing protein n=1 Tax=unclassified Bacillus (in: firmicutes) TaxID=185979 RepID=UPI0008F0E872|nr:MULTISPECIES: DUF421 domain-containing protein [unclassified Bacillus (in: firmicutes)]SFA78236.1 Uncharacterized membrane protein YcaP, DUF421 family [Bacillus sp. UNCCL13]SFQ68172.1 Uncharacterized membrane protein YcaP, DUF421 family [Bacillus sp. cl95]
MVFFHIFLELFVGYVALFLLTKILGKTTITQITTFDFISALVLGELVGNALFDENIGVKEILTAIFLWGSLVFATEIITQKFKGTRKLLEGEPSIVIRNGKIDYKVLKKNHLDINQLQHLLRSRDVFTIRECEFAILETDGTVSVLKKPNYSNPTAQDLNLKLDKVTLPVTIILDGELIKDNLQMIHWDEQRLLKEIKKYGAQSMEEVLYAEWLEGEALHVQTY